jgi:hypothetical protein
MKTTTTLLIYMVTSLAAWAQVPPTQTGKSAPHAQSHAVEHADEQSPHGKAAGGLKRPHLVPAGHTEKAVTIKPATGTIPTKECGAVSELTVLHRSHEPGMLTHVLSASKQGETLRWPAASALRPKRRHSCQSRSTARWPNPRAEGRAAKGVSAMSGAITRD